MAIIQLADDRADILRKQAATEGLSLEAWLEKLALRYEVTQQRKPFKIGRGMLKQYGLAPTAQEIDEDRREMLRGELP
jgi:hypothetical protein